MPVLSTCVFVALANRAIKRSCAMPWLGAGRNTALFPGARV
ncbi:hypothetical protein [Novosphingobium sp. SCN 63-17]|nr:hypothetical protein [Novosphingobium sp. SCN 63-17]